MKKVIAIAVFAALITTGALVYAQDGKTGSGAGKGRTQQQHKKQSQKDGSNCPMGQGMMGSGTGMGSGMMGQGQGMMGASGCGMGMTGCGMGQGMDCGMGQGCGMAQGMMSHGMGMAQGMMSHGMGGMMSGSGMDSCPMNDTSSGAAIYQSKEYQKFLDDTVKLRRELNAKRFDYLEALRNPKTPPEEVGKLLKELVELTRNLHEAASAAFKEPEAKK
jgi:hypothetical protein